MIAMIPIHIPFRRQLTTHTSQPDTLQLGMPTLRDLHTPATMGLGTTDLDTQVTTGTTITDLDIQDTMDIDIIDLGINGQQLHFTQIAAVTVKSYNESD
jgi:hypothetical protein